VKSNNTSLVSVIMPSYNHGHFIGETIKSVLSQTYCNIELIIIDNFSTDNTKEVISLYNDERLKVFYYENKGIIASARNYGVKKSRGEVLAFIDSDDIWYPNKLDVQLKYLSDYSISCISSNFIPIGDVFYFKRHLFFGKEEKYKDYGYNEIALANPVMTSSLLTKKEYFIDVGGFDESRDFCFIEDWELWLRMSRIANVRVLSESLIQYRIVKGKSRDFRDVSLRKLKIFDKHQSLGYISQHRKNVLLGNCFVSIGKAYLDANDRKGIKYYICGLRYSSGFNNKFRTIIGLFLFHIPLSIRKYIIESLYKLYSIINRKNK